jgi:hypothetical protein
MSSPHPSVLDRDRVTWSTLCRDPVATQSGRSVGKASHPPSRSLQHNLRRPHRCLLSSSLAPMPTQVPMVVAPLQGMVAPPGYDMVELGRWSPGPRQPTTCSSRWSTTNAESAAGVAWSPSRSRRSWCPCSCNGQGIRLSMALHRRQP